MTRPEIHPQEPAIDFSDLLARVENDRELLLDLIAMFREEFPRQRQILQAAVDAEDMKQAHATGHALKGIFANLAMTRAAKAAAQIEQAGKEQDATKLKAALITLDQETVSLFAELDRGLPDVQA